MGVFPDILEPLAALDMETLRRKYNAFNRLVQKEYENDGFFMTRKQFQEVFEIVQSDVTFRMFSCFDPQQNGQVVATDVFGGLTLASTGKEEVGVQSTLEPNSKRPGRRGRRSTCFVGGKRVEFLYLFSASIRFRFHVRLCQSFILLLL